MKNAQFTACASLKSLTDAASVSYGPTDYGYNLAYIGGYGGFFAPRLTSSVNASKMSATPVSLAKIIAPSESLLFADDIYTNASVGNMQRFPWVFPPSASLDQPTLAGSTLHARHLETCNVAFADGHVKAMKLNYSVRGETTSFRGTITKGSAMTDEYFNGTGQP